MQGLDEISCKELNPYNVVRHKLSTPPTIAASHKPDSIYLYAEANTFALDEHAVDIVTPTPFNPNELET